MSDANPVETKADPAPANPAAALAPPAPPAAGTGGGLWTKLVRYKTLGLCVGGSALVLASGWYGLTHFKPAPDKAAAQSAPAPEPTPPPAKADDPLKVAESIPDKGLDIQVPPVTTVATDRPATARPTEPSSLVITPPPMPDPDAKPPTDITAPPILPPDTPPPPTPGDDKTGMARPRLTATDGTSAGAVVAPPIPGEGVRVKPANDADRHTAADPLRKPAAADPFKAPGDLPDPDRKKPGDPVTAPVPLPTETTGRKEKADAPVITTGGTADGTAPPVPAGPTSTDITPPPPPVPGKTGEPKKEADPTGPPPVPMLDLNALPPAPAPMTDPKDGPAAINPPRPGDDKADPVKPPAAPDGKDNGLPPLIIPTKDQPPEVKPPALGPTIKVDDPPAIKSPMIPDMPPSGTSPPAVPLDPPAAPPGPPADPKKKEAFDEDWHTPRPGESVETVNYAEISREYYKTPDFAQALRAYNRDRRKTGDRIIRVPPTWVLKEQFPNLAPADRDARPAAPEARPTANVKFEPAVSPAPGSRPAPPPAIGRSGGNDEYRVTAAGGETIREVARQVFGDPNAWRRLAALNPDLDPTLPIPAGTTLRLPR